MLARPVPNPLLFPRQARRRLACGVVVGLLIGLAAQPAAARDDRPIRAEKDMVKYQLSNMRRESGRFGRSMIAFDFRKTQEGRGNPRLVASNSNGELSLSGFGPSLDSVSDTVRIDETLSFGATNNLEVYIAAEVDGLTYMVSNAVRLGNPGPPTTARAITEAERQQAEQTRIARTPPKSLPDGYVAVTVQTRLRPGMPVRVGVNGEWVDGEYINNDSRRGDLVNVRLPKTTDRLSSFSRAEWVAIDPDVLARGQSDPEAFSPSFDALPGTDLKMPEGTSLVGNAELPLGTPVMAGDGIWMEGYVLRDGDDTIRIRRKGLSEAFDTDVDRETVVIKDRIRELLGDDERTAKWADYVEGEDDSLFGSSSSRGAGSRFKTGDYPIRIAIPNDAEVVPEDLELPDGTALGANWGGRWYKLKLLKSNDDGTLRISWDDRSDVWDCDLPREQCIIASKEVRKLQRLAARGESAESADSPSSSSSRPSSRSSSSRSSSPFKSASKMRTWTDATGEFKIDATFVELDGDTVVLKTDDGEDLEIALDQLSAADRSYAKAQASRKSNPFQKR